MVKKAKSSGKRPSGSTGPGCDRGTRSGCDDSSLHSLGACSESCSDNQTSSAKRRKHSSHSETYDANGHGTGREPQDECEALSIHTEDFDHFSKLSLEVICHILDFLPIWDILKLECQCHHLQEAVNVHLRLLTDIDFTEGEIHGWMPSRITDNAFERLLLRCPELMYIYGLHFHYISRRRHRGGDSLTVPGMIVGLQQCMNLQGLETSDIFLLESVLAYLPNIEIMGTFKNRDGMFPIPPNNAITLTRHAQLTALHLTGVEMKELPRMDFLKRLHLKWVRFTDDNPFQDFMMPALKTFVMNNCAGPANALKYVPLLTGLVASRTLTRLELIRVPFLGGLIHHVVEDSWYVSGFRQLHKILIGSCKHAQESDLGYLMITSAARLEELYLQPSLTKDSFFYSLSLANIDLPKLTTLHVGFVDDFTQCSKWSQSELGEFGLAEYTENPAFLTDFGMKLVSDVFVSLGSLTVYNCPHLHLPTKWYSTGDLGGFSHITDLNLRRCHAIKLSDFNTFLSRLPCLENLNLEQMFREQPKGCSRVGLSKGTGLGVSSALVSDSDIVNQGGTNQNSAGQPSTNQNAHANEDDSDDEYSEEEFDEEDEDFSEEEVLIDVQVETQTTEQVKSPDISDADNDINDTHCDTHCEPCKHEQDNCQCQNNHKDTDKQKKFAQPKILDLPAPESADGSTVQTHDEVVEVDGYVWSEDKESDDIDTVNNMETVTMVTDTEKSGQSKTCTSGRDNKIDQSNSTKTTENMNESCQCKQTSLKDDHTSSEPKKVGCICSCGHCQPLRNNRNNIPHTSTSDNSQSGHSKVKHPKNSDNQSHHKGKSMWGTKKGLRRSGQRSDAITVSRSCQAVSEQIRESTKQAEQTTTVTSGGEKGKLDQSESKPTTGPSETTESSQTTKPSPTTKTSPEDKVACDDKAPCGEDQPSVDRTSSGELMTKILATSTQGQGCENISSGQQNGVKSRPCRVKRSKRSRRASKKPRSEMKDQGTSTTDPVIEEDHLQTLEIDSITLVNITLHHVGISDLAFNNCPKLQTLTGTACRMLRNVIIHQTPKLSRVTFQQCPKLRHEDLVDQVCDLPPERYRLILLRPVQQYSPENLERQLFSTASHKYHVCLVHDHSPNPEETIYNRIRVANWPDLITGLNYDLVKEKKIPDAAKVNSIRQQFPWRQGTYRMQGHNANGSVWDMVSDVPWIQTLSAQKNCHNPYYLPSDDKAGVYSPSAKGHCNHLLARETVKYDIADIKYLQRPLYLYPAVVFVDTCDIGGVIPDIYV